MGDMRGKGWGGEWTKDKLERLRKYLCAYTTALKNQPFELIYIDAFAGTGYWAPNASKQREEEQLLAIPVLAEPEPQEYLRGSARIALETDPPFHRYVFIDRDPNHCAELENLKVEFPTLAHKIDVITSDANEYLRTEAHGDWRLRRAVLFLDPYGMQVEWKTLEAIAGTRAVDVWYLFPLGAVNRLLAKSGNIPDAWRERLNRLFGDSGWEKVFYQKGTSIGLFGNEEFTEKTATFYAIRNYLLDRLKSVFSAVSKNPLVLSNSRGAPLFLLCFAVSNEKGAPIALRIADYILSA